MENPTGSVAVGETALSRDYKHHWTPVHFDLVVDNLADAVTTAQTRARACLISSALCTGPPGPLHWAWA
ncbi:MAG: hypothetical protein M3294_06530 [Pseudomonadota bacterium]|nr:hypothetical protein [Pseudomonadota bacterium]